MKKPSAPKYTIIHHTGFVQVARTRDAMHKTVRQWTAESALHEVLVLVFGKKAIRFIASGASFCEVG